MSFLKRHMQVNFTRKEVLILLLSIVFSIFHYDQNMALADADQAPMIIVKGETEVSIQVGENYEDEGVIAYDFQQGFITQYVTVLGSVDTFTPGVYTLIYNVRDKDWNYAETKTRKVRVILEKSIENDLEIVSHEVKFRSETEGDILFETNKPTQAVVAYGLLGKYDNFTRPEKSFQYKKHRQPLYGISKSEAQNYKIMVKDQQGNTEILEGNFGVIPKIDTPRLINIKEGAIIAPDQQLEFTAGNTELIQWIIRVGTEENHKKYYNSERLSPEASSYSVTHLPVGENVVLRLGYKKPSGKWEFVKYNLRVEATSGTLSNTFSPGTATGWPKNTNNNLPYAGIFYGINGGGVGIQNAGIGVESSRRFRAEKTGTVERVAYNNRVLTDFNVASRCLPSDPDSIWCKCVDAGLDKYTCGYTLGSSYSVGNGGRITIELRTDNGKGYPSSTVLAKTKQFIPMELEKTPWLKLDLSKDVHVVAGQVYHLVFLNDRPPTKCPKLTHYTVEQAKNCDRDRGAIGLNGSRYFYPGTEAGKFGPYLGDDSSATLFKRSSGSSWSLYQSSISFYEIGYSDGTSTGETTFPYYGNREGTGKNTVEGSKRLRQSFTVKDASRKVNGLWVVVGHNNATNGTSLFGQLKDENGKILATTKIAPASACLKSGMNREFCRDWVYGSFGKTVNLEEGKKYYMEFSGLLGAGFTLTTVETLVKLASKNNTEYWHDAKAEYSTDGGKTWGGSSNRYASLRDVGILFTIEGMPKKLHVDF